MRRPLHVSIAFAALLSLGLTGLGMLGLPPVADAQQAGSVVTFLVPSGMPITAASDVVVYIAQPQGFMTVGGNCTIGATTAFPVHNGVITDPGGGRATRFIGLITVSQTTPVPSGTLVDNLSGPTSCTTASGLNEDKWQGTVK